MVDPERREITRGSQAITPGPQVFDLLVHLVRNRERVVSKEDLIEAVWGGRIVSESTLTSHINAVRKAIGDTGARQRLVRTIARKGYRFVGDVREGAVLERPATAVLGEPPAEALALPDRPSIAVLPFVNLSGDPAQDYFVDGVVDDIISALSRSRRLFVIARNSSFTYKDGADASWDQGGDRSGPGVVCQGDRARCELCDSVRDGGLVLLLHSIPIRWRPGSSAVTLRSSRTACAEPDSPIDDRVVRLSDAHCSGRSAGVPLFLINTTRNFAGWVALAFRSTR